MGILQNGEFCKNAEVFAHDVCMVCIRIDFYDSVAGVDTLESAAELLAWLRNARIAFCGRYGFSYVFHVHFPYVVVLAIPTGTRFHEMGSDRIRFFWYGAYSLLRGACSVGWARPNSCCSAVRLMFVHVRICLSCWEVSKY